MTSQELTSGSKALALKTNQSNSFKETQVLQSTSNYTITCMTQLNPLPLLDHFLSNLCSNVVPDVFICLCLHDLCVLSAQNIYCVWHWLTNHLDSNLVVPTCATCYSDQFPVYLSPNLHCCPEQTSHSIFLVVIYLLAS